MNKERVIQALEETIGLLGKRDFVDDMIRASDTIAGSLQRGGTLFICGNGGSAEQAAHFAGEMVGRFKKERKGIRAVALGMTTAVLTAWSNDYSYEDAFARELEALGKKGDVLVGLSTSGNSKNVIRAVEKAKEMGMQTVGLLGEGGNLLRLVDRAISVPSRDTARIQEVHLFVIHMLSETLEDSLSQ